MLNTSILNWLTKHFNDITNEEIKIINLFHTSILADGNHEISKKDFDIIFDKQKQKLLGITYTPKAIRERLTNYIIEELKKEKDIENTRISDPCCGSGLFTITLIEKLLSLKIDHKKIIENIVYISDIDKISVLISLVNIYEFFKNLNIDITNYRLNAQIQDFIHSTGKFDAYITNPPYVKIQNITPKNREFLKNTYPELFFGSMGLSTIFLKKMLDGLNENGMLGIITQNNLFTSNAAKKLRKEIQFKIKKIETFGSSRIFEGVNAYTCLLYLQKKDLKSFKYKKIKSFTDLNKKSDFILNKSLHYSKWRLGSSSELEDINNLEKKGIALGDACTIWVGIATQFDKGFTVFKKKNKWYGSDPDGIEHEVESNIVKKLIRIADIDNESFLKKNNRGIIYPYKIESGKILDFSESELSKTYPKTFTYLLKWKKRLNERQKGNFNKDDWFKWGRIQSMHPTKNKILTKTFDKKPNFYFDKSDSLFSNGYALNTKLSTFDLNFVHKVLNSKVFEYYMKITSFEIEGDYQCYQKNFIEKFNLPFIDIETQKKVTKENKVDSFYKKYFKLNLNI